MSALALAPCSASANKRTPLSRLAPDFHSHHRNRTRCDRSSKKQSLSFFAVATQENRRCATRDVFTLEMTRSLMIRFGWRARAALWRARLLPNVKDEPRRELARCVPDLDQQFDVSIRSS